MSNSSKAQIALRCSSIDFNADGDIMPRVEQVKKVWYRDVDGIVHLTEMYAQQRSTLFARLFQSRPLAELRKAIDLFRALQYQEAISALVENVLTKQVSPDYFHMALCYVVRSYSRIGMLSHAERLYRLLEELGKPPSYAITGEKLEEEVRHDIEECRKRFANGNMMPA